MAGSNAAERCRILHSLRIKGVAEAEDLAAATGLGSDALEAILAELSASGLVERRNGVLAGWKPTALSIKQCDAWLAEELEGADSRAQVEQAYRAFLELNPALLKVCTAWQLVTGEDGSPVPNDHGDASYDASVVARLAEIDRRAQVVVLSLESQLPRFDQYRRRLRTALERVQAGEGEWFTRALIDSYHQVWFELHQDLLFTLGLERTSEDGRIDEQEQPGEPG